MLGLKRGQVSLCDHQPEWGEKAAELIRKMKTVFGSTAVDIQHIGSTAIYGIKAKPMLDIAIGVKSFEGLDSVFTELEKFGIYKSIAQPLSDTILCAVKTSKDSDTCLCVPHIVIFNGPEWNNYISFRNYMNAFPEKAKQYEKLKTELAERFTNNRSAYSNGKKDFIIKSLDEARIYTELKK